eukprot:13516706-Alexandrium_andersonii.AAC.1
MSASLVGSEMCIRDRSLPRGIARQPEAQGIAGGGATARAEHGSRGQSTVSYTHLTLPTICSV